MANIRLIKRRKRCKEHCQITKAMEMIAPSKMRKHRNVDWGRPYSEKITRVISNLMAVSSGQPCILPDCQG